MSKAKRKKSEKAKRNEKAPNNGKIKKVGIKLVRREGNDEEKYMFFIRYPVF
jgi:hypothetical protein